MVNLASIKADLIEQTKPNFIEACAYSHILKMYRTDVFIDDFTKDQTISFNMREKY